MDGFFVSSWLVLPVLACDVRASFWLGNAHTHTTARIHHRAYSLQR